MQIPNFIIPTSTTKISDMAVTLFNSAGTPKGAFSGAVIDGFVADKMTSASIKANSPIIGQKSATIEITF